MQRLALVLVVLTACQPSPPTPLYPAGSDRDEGHGLLARASSHLSGNADDAPDKLAERTRRRVPIEDDRDDLRGPASYGGVGYGGATYASYVPPPWTYPSVNRMPTYTAKPSLRGAIEGTITWRGPTPTLTTACGAITPVRTGPGRTLAGAVVYLDKLTVGRVPSHASGEMRPSSVGGVVVKRGCSLTPTTQLVWPVPAQVAIHGDRTPARLAISLPGNERRTTVLEDAGRIALPMTRGVLGIHADDGTLGSAFVIGLDTPAFALTDDAGRFRIDELAPGTYDLVVWHAPIPTLVAGKLVYGMPITTHRTVVLDRERTLRVDLSLGAK